MAGWLGFLRLLYRLPWFALHVLLGTPLAVVCQASVLKTITIGDRSLGEVMITWWSRMVCRILACNDKSAAASCPVRS